MSQDTAARSCARSGDIIEPDRPDMSVGRHPSDFRNSCQAPKSKIFRFSRRGKSVHLLDQPGPHEGRFAIVTMRWAGLRWTLWRQVYFFAPDENAEAYGEVVWSWRRDAGAKLRGNIPRSDGGKKARSPGRARSKP